MVLLPYGDLPNKLGVSLSGLLEVLVRVGRDPLIENGNRSFQGFAQRALGE